MKTQRYVWFGQALDRNKCLWLLVAFVAVFGVISQTAYAQSCPECATNAVVEDPVATGEWLLTKQVNEVSVIFVAARKGKPGPKPKPKKERPNLFEIHGIKPWTLHDARRTLTTFLDDQKLGGAASAILGHKMDHDRVDESERMASITEQHYNRSQRIGLKAEGMALWVKTLLAAYEIFHPLNLRSFVGGSKSRSRRNCKKPPVRCAVSAIPQSAPIVPG